MGSMGPLAFTILLTAAVLVFLSILIRQTEHEAAGPVRLCGNGCGYVNSPVARYCAKCGRLLTAPWMGRRRAG